jgi:hypothetical protein
MPRILVATGEGLHELGDGAVPVRVHHAGRAVTTVVEWEKQLWAIVDGSEVWHAAEVDGWTHLGDLEHYRGTCLAFMEDDVVVGSSEARLFRLVGDGLEPVAAFDRAEGRSTWYTPWGGPPDTRSMSEWGEAVYVNVHVGGILRTEDRGETWTPTIDIDADVHQVVADPLVAGYVVAATARGLAESVDGGRSWRFSAEGLHASYSRAVALDGDVLCLSASTGPRGGRAAVYRRRPGEDAFERCAAGLPEWIAGNVDSHCLAAGGGGVVFGTEDGRVFTSDDGGGTWDTVAEGVGQVTCACVGVREQDAT